MHFGDAAGGFERSLWFGSDDDQGYAVRFTDVDLDADAKLRRSPAPRSCSLASVNAARGLSNRTHIKHYESQKLTVRESGAGPACRNRLGRDVFGP